MAISIRCKCKTEAKLGTKICPNCYEPFPRKGKVFKVTVRAHGRKITRTVKSLESARTIEAKLKIQIAEGEFDINRKKAAPKLEAVWAKYVPWAMHHKKTWVNDTYNYEKHLGPRFGNKHLDNISHLDVEAFVLSLKRGKNKREEPYAPATIRHQLILLSRLYNLAEQWGMYEGSNPCKRVKKPKLNNQVTEFLTEEEVVSLLDVLETFPDRVAAGTIKFALFTGMRRGELFRLEWKDIDFEHQTVTIRDPKGGIDQTFPLSNETIELLNELPRTFNTNYIFHGPKGRKRAEIRRPWKAIKQEAGLPPDFRFHGLRHHFASALASNGVDLYTIQRLLTHKDVSTTQRYAHLTDQRLREAITISESILNPKTESNSEVITLWGNSK